MNLTELEKKISQAPCPSCKSVKFEIQVRCDLDHSGCVNTAKCQNCGTTFLVYNSEDNIKADGHSIEKAEYVCSLENKSCYLVEK